MSSDRSSKQDITQECILRAKCNISSEMKQHECEPCSLCGGWSILYEKVSGGCCFMTQLLTATSIIKSSAVQNLNTDGPFDTVTTPDCVFEMKRLLLLKQLALWLQSTVRLKYEFENIWERQVEGFKLPWKAAARCLFSFYMWWFRSWGNDELWLTAGLLALAHHCPSSQQRLRGAGGGGLVKAGERRGN